MTSKLHIALMLLLLATLAGCGDDSPTKSRAPMSWMTVRTPSIAGGRIAVSSDRMVALEPGYGVRVSLDTKNWKEVVLKGTFAGIPENITCVNDVFILWGVIDYQSQTEIMLVSGDGFRWYEATTDSRTYGPSFAYRQGRFLMATENGELWQSQGSLPTRWKRLPPPVGGCANGYALAASSDYFLAIDSVGRVLRSEHGDEWSKIDSVHFWGIFCGAPGKLIWDGNRFLFARGALLLSSPNGTSWSVVHDGWNVCIEGMASFANHIILLTSDYRLVLTTAGDKIESRSIGVSASISDVTWGQGQFVTSGTPVLCSPDAIHWDTLTLDQRPIWNFWDVAWGNGQFLAVGGTTVCASSDGFHWRQLPQPPEEFRSVIWTGQEFLAMDFNSSWQDTLRIFSSPDGMSWQLRYSQARLGGTLGLDYAGGVLFTKGCMGAYLWSEDGAIWHQASTPGERGIIVDFDYIRHRWVCAGAGVYVSHDASTWSPVWPKETSSIQSEALVNIGDRLITVSWEGTVYSSADGLSWQQLTSSGPAMMRDMAWMDSTIVAVCNGPAIATSRDGIRWSTTPLTVNDVIWSVACNETRAVAVGLNGSIVVSR